MIESRQLSAVSKLSAQMKAAIRPEQYHGWYLSGDLETAIGIMCSYRFVSYCQKLKICLKVSASVWLGRVCSAL